jgi:hypothetical protein
MLSNSEHLREQLGISFNRALREYDALYRKLSFQEIKLAELKPQILSASVIEDRDPVWELDSRQISPQNAPLDDGKQSQLISTLRSTIQYCEDTIEALKPILQDLLKDSSCNQSHRSESYLTDIKDEPDQVLPVLEIGIATAQDIISVNKIGCA